MTAEVQLTIPKLWSLMLQRLKKPVHGKAAKVKVTILQVILDEVHAIRRHRDRQKEGKIRILQKET